MLNADVICVATWQALWQGVCVRWAAWERFRLVCDGTAVSQNVCEVCKVLTMVYGCAPCALCDSCDADG